MHCSMPAVTVERCAWLPLRASGAVSSWRARWCATSVSLPVAAGVEHASGGAAAQPASEAGSWRTE